MLWEAVGVLGLARGSGGVCDGGGEILSDAVGVPELAEETKAFAAGSAWEKWRPEGARSLFFVANLSSRPLYTCSRCAAIASAN